MGLLNTIGIGRRAIGAAAAGIDVTSQNVANANTVGYSRRRVLQETMDPIHRRGVFVGQGVDVVGITRASDRILGARLVSSAGAHAQSSAAEETLRTAETAFSETNATGIAEAFSRFYDALSSVTADPSDLSRRTGAVDAAQAFTGVLSRTARELDRQVEGIDTTLNDVAVSLNGTLREIAALNKAIGRQGASTGPGDLLDRRDQLVYSLGESIGATVDLQEDGSATVFIGNQAVVSGNEARTVSIAEDAAGDAQVYVSAGTGAIRVTDGVSGNVGGRLEARGRIVGWLNDLNDFADAFGTTINAQHAAGFDANGTAGGAVFTWSATDPAASFSVDAALAADGQLLALAGASPATVGDTTNLAALIDTEDAAVYGAGTTGAAEISRVVSEVGASVVTASSDAVSYGAQLDDLTAMRDSVSKVDSDEEAIRLVEYQAAYRAASRVLQVGDELLQTLMQLGA